MKRLGVALLVSAAVAAAAAAAWIARGDTVPAAASPSEEAGLAVQRSMVHPGTIMLFARNEGDEAVTIAQVLVNDAYVAFDALRLTVPPNRQTRVDVHYPWVAGEAYEIGLLTAEGDIVEYELEDAGTA